MLMNKETSGFIAQDGFVDHMFVMPGSCTGFGCVLPAVGTKLVYSVVLDAKTTRRRVEGVHAQDIDSIDSEQF